MESKCSECGASIEHAHLGAQGKNYNLPDSRIKSAIYAALAVNELIFEAKNENLALCGTCAQIAIAQLEQDRAELEKEIEEQREFINSLKDEDSELILTEIEKLEMEVKLLEDEKKQAELELQNAKDEELQLEQQQLELKNAEDAHWRNLNKFCGEKLFSKQDEYDALLGELRALQADKEVCDHFLPWQRMRAANPDNRQQPQ